ncbi:hypothetical protein DK27_22655 [Xanthomonas arboricola pv. pruni]|nr:hypothetical protein DK27_22655 [Xanthomonas arboricola pv. pruni]GAE58683.1 hypothetical protein XPN_0589 [Xanthomonas arboricola pv. pruni MAFF 301427]
MLSALSFIEKTVWVLKSLAYKDLGLFRPAERKQLHHDGLTALTQIRLQCFQVSGMQPICRATGQTHSTR